LLICEVTTLWKGRNVSIINCCCFGLGGVCVVRMRSCGQMLELKSEVEGSVPVLCALLSPLGTDCNCQRCDLCSRVLLCSDNK